MLQRKEPRTLCSKSILFSLDAENPQSNHVFGVVYDLSPSGAGIISSYPLETGRIIRIEQGLESYLKRPALVRWSRKISENIYRIGVMFLPEDGKQ